MARRVGVLPLWLATVVSGTVFAASEQPRSWSGVLEPGWNLVTVPFDVSELPPSWQARAVWPALRPEAGPALSNNQVLQPVTVLEAGLGYWVHSTSEASYLLHAGANALEPKTLASRQPGWHFISVTKAQVYADPRLGRVLRWDALAQAHVPVRVGETLVPGVGYFGRLDSEGALLAHSCVPSTWGFQDAISAIEGCPFSEVSTHIVPRTQWSIRRPQTKDAWAPASRVVIHHTATRPTISMRALEKAVVYDSSDSDLEYHFVIAQDEEGTWQVYEGRALARSAAGERGVPSEVHVAVAGTYEAIQPAAYHETQFGFASSAPEAERQPPLEAVLRLADLTAFLTTRFSAIEDVVPYAQGARAAYPGAGLSPGSGLLHIVEALGARFLKGGALPESAPDEADVLPVEDDSDREAPLLLVYAPRAPLSGTHQAWVSLEGEVHDAALEGLYLNGVKIAEETTRFSQAVDLVPGENVLKLVAVDRAGHVRRVLRRVVRDDLAPVLNVAAFVASGDAADPTVEFQVQVSEENLARLGVNGVPLPLGHELVYTRSAAELPTGVSFFDFEAIDRAGNWARHQVAVERDDTHVRVLPEAESRVESSDVPPAILTDEAPPILHIESPGAPLVYTRQNVWNVLGSVEASEAVRISINGVFVEASTTAFSHSVRLFEDATDVRIVARGPGGHESQAEFTVVLDTASPVIDLFGAKKRVVHEAEFVLRGRINEAHLAEATWFEEGALAPEPLETADGLFEVAVTLTEGTHRFVLEAIDLAGNRASSAIEITYQDGLAEGRPPQPPTALSAGVLGRTVRVFWRAPKLFEDGREIPKGVELVHNLYRDDTMIQAGLVGTAYDDTVPEAERAYRYHATTVVRDRSGTPFESKASDPLSVEVTAPRSVTEPGHFEPAEVLAEAGSQALLPATALSSHEGAVLAHVVYVLGPDEDVSGERVVYQRSEKAGKPGSFGAPQVVAELEAGATATDLVVAARAGRVSVVWTHTTHAESTVEVAQSHNAGRSFRPARAVRGGPAFKRGLDGAYDHNLDFHLVWGEAHKAFYLKNFEGEPSNVFDVRRRKPATEEVRYMVQYEPGGEGCRCEGCWCPESYPLSEEPNPDDEGRPFGAYLYRTEEAYVYQPSLHVDDHAVSIVVRQTRLWDAEPVPHEAWTAMASEPVFSEQVVQRLLPTRLVTGWREVWKDAYEAGDEARVDALGVAYQYRYRGTWHERDLIKVAQRPLVAGAWAGSDAADGHQGWRQGAWIGDAEQSWRVSVVAEVGQGGDDKPSHPKLASTPSGLVAVFEDGPSDDPNRSGENAVRFALSSDGGVHWSRASRVASGYLPNLAATRGGAISVLTYVPDSAAGGAVHGAQSSDGGVLFVEGQALNDGLVKPVHWGSHAQGADRLMGRPALVALDELFFAAWVETDDIGLGRDRVVTTRASSLSDVTQYGVSLPDHVVQGKSTRVTVTAENAYHMRVNDSGTVRLSRGSSSGGAFGGSGYAPSASGPETSSDGGQTPATPIGHAPWASGGVSLASVAPESRSVFSPDSLELQFHGGEATAWVDPVALAVEGDAGLAVWATAGLAEGTSASGFGDDVPSFQPTAKGNYEKAQWMRDQLWREGVGETGPIAYQVEYEAVSEDGSVVRQASDWLTDNFEAGRGDDSKHLAGFERVWAYTQGIALAQLARQEDTRFYPRAQALARYLCEQAARGTHDGEAVIKGWHFSWNTRGDSWKDVRLVTGATAWVVHGLGAFLVSPAYEAMDEAQRAPLLTCYQQSLRGLALHRWSGESEGRQVSLMTAGWTVRGLNEAATPRNIAGPDGQRLATEGETWAYYSVLDAVGYDEYDSEKPPAIAREFERPNPVAGDWLVGTAPRVLTEEEYRVLKEEVRAQNVVTEHNLDVLSVLNHALNHASELGLDDRASLEAWRDEVRDGLFYILWDDNNRLWIRDLSAAGRSTPPDSTKREQIDHALMNDDEWGRVATGGVIVAADDAHRQDGVWRPGRVHIQAGDEDFYFTSLAHTAIDNCSWLSLSVDYDALPEAEYVNRLARCLEFTTLGFAKDMEFKGKNYYGTHYFFDGFEDRYIRPSSRQEQSFHLEATAGLILGLLKFIEHHPEHAKALFFREEALKLWAGVQAFVADHGFPYSSQRIQDLSTLLTSSTALIWFIDVYEYSDRQLDEGQRPLLHYATDVNLEAVDRGVAESYEGLKALTSTTTHRVYSGRADDGRVFTRIDEQAAVVMAALHRSDDESAVRWADALMDAHRLVELSGGQDVRSTHKAFPVVVDQSTGEALFDQHDIATEMAAYYALGLFIEAFRDRDQAQVDRARNILGDGLRAKVGAYFRRTRLGPGGLFSRRQRVGSNVSYESPSPEDNVMAYFALVQAEASTPSLGMTSLLGGAGREGFEASVSQLCEATLQGDTDQDVTRVRDSEAVGRSLVMCAMFSAEIDEIIEASVFLEAASSRLERARRVQGVLGIGREARSTTSWTAFIGDESWVPNGWVSLAGEALARRAASVIDPRQEELALEELDWLVSLDGNTASYYASVLFLYQPLGVLGLEAAPLFVPGTAPGFAGVSTSALELKKMQRDAIRALLITPFSEGQFDAMVHRVALFGFARRQFEDGVAPGQWPATYRQDWRTWFKHEDALLRDLCSRDLSDEEYPHFESFFGMSCEDASALYEGLRVYRTGSSENAWIAAVEAPKDLQLVDLLRVLHAGWGQTELYADFGTSLDCVTCVVSLADVELPAGSVSKKQAVLRQALSEKIDEQLILSHLRDSPESELLHLLDFRWVDAIDAFNPRAPEYWSHHATVFRQVYGYRGLLDLEAGIDPNDLDLAFDETHAIGFSVTYKGRTYSPPVVQRTENVRLLRQRLNHLWGGNLVAAARSFGVAPAVLHEAMRTGVLAPKYSHAMAASERVKRQPPGEAPELTIVEASGHGRLTLSSNGCRSFTVVNSGTGYHEPVITAEFVGSEGFFGGATVSVNADRLDGLNSGETGGFEACLDILDEDLDGYVGRMGPLSESGWVITISLPSQGVVKTVAVDMASSRDRDWMIRVAAAAKDGSLSVGVNTCQTFEVFNNRREAIDWEAKAIAHDADGLKLSVGSQEPSGASVQEQLDGENGLPHMTRIDQGGRRLEPGAFGWFELCLDMNPGLVDRVKDWPHETGRAVEIAVAGEGERFAYPIKMLSPSDRSVAWARRSEQNRLQIKPNSCRDIELSPLSVLEGQTALVRVAPRPGAKPKEGLALRVEGMGPIATGDDRAEVTVCLDASQGAIEKLFKDSVLVVPTDLSLIVAVAENEESPKLKEDSGEASFSPRMVFDVDMMREGLAGHWTFDGHARDRQNPEAQEAVFPGWSSSWVAGKFGQSLGAGMLVDVPAAAPALQFHDIGAPFAVSFWLERPASQRAKPASIIGTIGLDGARRDGWGIALDGDDRLEFRIKRRNSMGISFARSPVVWDGSWAHVVVAWDGRSVSMYANGETIRAHDEGGERPHNTGSITSGSPIRMGWPYGALDDMRIYRGVLSEDAIAALASAVPSPGDDVVAGASGAGQTRATLCDASQDADCEGVRGAMALAAPEADLTASLWEAVSDVSWDTRAFAEEEETLFIGTLPGELPHGEYPHLFSAYVAYDTVTRKQMEVVVYRQGEDPSQAVFRSERVPIEEGEGAVYPKYALAMPSQGSTDWRIEPEQAGEAYIVRINLWPAAERTEEPDLMVESSAIHISTDAIADLSFERQKKAKNREIHRTIYENLDLLDSVVEDYAGRAKRYRAYFEGLQNETIPSAIETRLVLLEDGVTQLREATAQVRKAVEEKSPEWEAYNLEAKNEDKLRGSGWALMEFVNLEVDARWNAALVEEPDTAFKDLFDGIEEHAFDQISCARAEVELTPESCWFDCDRQTEVVFLLPCEIEVGSRVGNDNVMFFNLGPRAVGYEIGFGHIDSDGQLVRATSELSVGPAGTHSSIGWFELTSTFLLAHGQDADLMEEMDRFYVLNVENLGGLMNEFSSKGREILERSISVPVKILDGSELASQEGEDIRPPAAIPKDSDARVEILATRLNCTENGPEFAIEATFDFGTYAEEGGPYTAKLSYHDPQPDGLVRKSEIVELPEAVGRVELAAGFVTEVRELVIDMELLNKNRQTIAVGSKRTRLPWVEMRGKTVWSAGDDYQATLTWDLGDWEDRELHVAVGFTGRTLDGTEDLFYVANAPANGPSSLDVELLWDEVTDGSGFAKYRGISGGANIMSTGAQGQFCTYPIGFYPIFEATQDCRYVDSSGGPEVVIQGPCVLELNTALSDKALPPSIVLRYQNSTPGYEFGATAGVDLKLEQELRFGVQDRLYVTPVAEEPTQGMIVVTNQMSNKEFLFPFLIDTPRDQELVSAPADDVFGVRDQAPGNFIWVPEDTLGGAALQPVTTLEGTVLQAAEDAAALPLRGAVEAWLEEPTTLVVRVDASREKEVAALSIEMACYEIKQAEGASRRLLFRAPLHRESSSSDRFRLDGYDDLTMTGAPFVLDAAASPSAVLPVLPFAHLCEVVAVRDGAYTTLSEPFWWQKDVHNGLVPAPIWAENQGTPTLRLGTQDAFGVLSELDGATRRSISEEARGYHVYFWRADTRSWHGETSNIPSSLYENWRWPVSPRPWPSTVKHLYVPMDQEFVEISEVGGEPLAGGLYQVSVAADFGTWVDYLFTANVPVTFPGDPNRPGSGLLASYDFDGTLRRHKNRDSGPHGLHGQASGFSTNRRLSERISASLSGTMALPQVPALDFDEFDDFLISLWVYPNSGPKTGGVIIGNIPAGVGPGWQLAVEPKESEHQRTFHLQGRLVGGGKSVYPRVSAQLEPDTWNHIAVTHVRTSRHLEVTYYVNAVYTRELNLRWSSGSQSGQVPSFGTGAPIVIGGALDGEKHVNRFHGAIDDVAFYRGVYGPGDVVRLFSDERP